MHILFLTQILPFPLDAGPKIKTYHVLRYLFEEGHKVTLVSFVRREEEAYIPQVEQICAAVHAVPIRRSRIADLYYFLRSNFTGRPFLVERDDLAAMRRKVGQILADESIDVIHADQLTMAQFALPFGSPAVHASSTRQDENGSVVTKAPGFSGCPVLVFDAHNAVWTIIERMRETAPWFLKPLARLEANRVKRYEGRIVRDFDHTLAVTELDSVALHQAFESAGAGGKADLPQILVVPITVDTSQLEPIERVPGSLNILTLGTLHYPPNADGIRWFMNEVFPLVLSRVPGASLTIVGKNPPQDFQDAAKDSSSIRVTGYVPDLVPYMQQAAVMVIPVRAGGGMRVRLLEAFSRAMPVVTTTVGLEGIDAEDGVEVVVKDTAEDFAGAVVQLIQETELQTSLAENARILAQSRYDWREALKNMQAIYQRTA